jgi:hypothetical protein
MNFYLFNSWLEPLRGGILLKTIEPSKFLDLKPTLKKSASSIFSPCTHTVHRMITGLEYLSECELIFKAMNQGTRLFLSKKNE